MTSEAYTEAARVVLENKEEFLSVFPELEKSIALLENAENAPGCKSCTKRKYERDILSVLTLVDKTGRDVGRLVQLGNPHITGSVLYQPKSTDLRPAPDESIPSLPQIKETDNEVLKREGCPDCVCKHLSQALILMEESAQGYPEHVKLALKRVKLAGAYSTGKNVAVNKKLKKIESELLSIMDEASTESDTTFHLRRALEITEDILSGRSAHPLAVWRIIGHMGEAADECLTDSPELAAEIRAERLLLMEDPEYKPRIAYFLNKARKLR